MLPSLPGGAARLTENGQMRWDRWTTGKERPAEEGADLDAKPHGSVIAVDGLAEPDIIEFVRGADAKRLAY